MEDFRITYRELGYYIVYVNIGLGVLFGSLPLIMGLILKKGRLGFIGFACIVIGGGVLGIFLSYPLALIFLWLIIRKRNGSDSVPSAPTDDTPDL